jgi:hypothetical protein
MKSWLRICGIVAVFSLPVGLHGQLICLPSGNCSCENEKISPNLTIARPVKLTGALIDPSGAPLHFNMTTIQVRNLKNNEVLFSSILDEQGRFDLGTVPAGKFRLVAFWMEEKRVRRLPLFDQPKPVFCLSENECKLEIVLALHGTDQPFEFCPPK